MSDASKNPRRRKLKGVRSRSSFGQSPSTKEKIQALDHATDSVMIRGLDGNIRFWNQAAEKYYGWSRGHALGHVSHELLHTVFPIPLREINRRLVENGTWEGELLHTVSDGKRIKVWSRWELRGKEAQGTPQAVIEINKVATDVHPDTAHLDVLPPSARILMFLWERRRWWLYPALAVFGALWVLMRLTEGHVLVPLLD